MRKIAYLVLALAAGCVYSCATNSDAPSSTSDVANSGSVNLPLVTTTAEGRSFRLENASFKFVGASNQTVSAPADAKALQIKLPVGSYTVELLSGWQLSELLSAGVAQHVEATVSGANPLPLVVTKDGTTDAIFQLQLSKDPTGATGTGRVRFEVLTNTCVPKAVADCRIENVDCGTMSDGCGGNVDCGTCATGKNCVAGKCVCPAPSCAALGAECGTAKDVCGAAIDCGVCLGTKVCDAATNKCVDPPCLKKTCSDLGLECGGASDGCGGSLTCGTCATGSTCNAAGKCIPVCVPSTTCSGGVECGTGSDGCGGTISCGSCGEGKICNDVGKCVTAPCKPKTCSELGKQCGAQEDGCGGALDCGKCATGQTCSSAGVCECEAKTCASAGAQCGSISNGCGATIDCGVCAAGSACSSTNMCVCAPKTCASVGAVCGTVSDGCGATLSCGTCPSGQACNTANKCACVPTTCSALGVTCGSASDGCGGTLTCGTCATGDVCSTAGKCEVAPQIKVSAIAYTSGSPWPGGYCGNFTVTNSATKATKGWNVVVNLKGATVTSIWNSTRTAVTAGSQFTAASYNAVIPAAGTTTFGFCTSFTGSIDSVVPVVVSAAATY